MEIVISTILLEILRDIVTRKRQELLSHPYYVKIRRLVHCQHECCFKKERETIILFHPLEIVVTPIHLHDITRNFSNSRTIWFQTIRLFVTSRLFNTTKKKKAHLLSPFSLLYPSILADTPRSHYRGKGEKEAREERKNGVAKKGGERKREFSDPLFYPPLLPRSKSREPLSHRLLDACKYPWQRGATMRSDPLAFAY